MAKQERYFVGPGLLGDIREVITRVDAIAPKTSGPEQPVRLQDLQRPGTRLRRGTFTGTWNIGETAAVEIVGSTQTVAVTNYCTPIKGQTNATQTLNVVYGSVMGTMTAVEIQQPTDAIRIGRTTAEWTKGTLATIILYEAGTPPSETAASPTETLNDCVNKFATVPANKWVALARAANGYWYLIAAECF